MKFTFYHLGTKFHSRVRNFTPRCEIDYEKTISATWQQQNEIITSLFFCNGVTHVRAGRLRLQLGKSRRQWAARLGLA
jgi:hypothetical protein